jgi:hypothetical protein
MPEALHKIEEDPQEQIKIKDDKTACETPISSPEREASGSFSSRKESRNVVSQTPENSAADIDSAQDYTDWPLKDITEPSKNDVLYGRGGGTNHHDGNKRYRRMVEKRKTDYVNCKRIDKPLISLDIIREWRAQKPPGRFLKLDESSGLWYDVGDRKAREKTSQALREKAPQLRKQQDEIDEETQQTKNTRFTDSATKTRTKKSIAKGILARNHSLGIDYVKEGEVVSVKGFSWESDDDTGAPIAESASYMQQWSSKSSFPNHKGYYYHSGPPQEHSYTPDTYHSSYPPPFPTTPNAHDRWHHHSIYPGPQYPQSDEKVHESWAHNRYPIQESRYERKVRSAEGEHRGGYSHRWYPEADIDTPVYTNNHAPSDTEKNIHWNPRQSNAYHHYRNFPHDHYGAPPHDWSSPNTHTLSERHPANSKSSAWSDPEEYTGDTLPHPIHTYNVHEQRQSFSSGQQFRSSPLSRPDHSSESQSANNTDHAHPIPRPQPIKRDTSNQNESVITRPSGIKKSNRQRSSEYETLNSVTDNDMSILGNHMRQTSIGEIIEKPQALSTGDRVQTIDAFEFGIDGDESFLDATSAEQRPPALHMANRAASIPFDDVEAIVYGNGRPSVLSEADRLPTVGSIDFNDITS